MPKNNAYRFPKAKKIDHSFEHLGESFNDEYHWLRNHPENEVIAELIEKENTYFFNHFPKEGLQSQLFEELKNKQPKADMDVPEKIDNFFYYSRTEENKEYEIHCRKKDSLENPEEIYFDENEFAEKDYFDLGCLEIDSLHKNAIYAVDDSGDEVYKLFHLNLVDRNITNLNINNSSGDVEWINKENYIYYIEQDESLRPFRLMRMNLSNMQKETIFEEAEPEYFLSLSSSKDENYIFVESHGSITSEIYYLDANDTKAELISFQEKIRGVEYYIDHRDGYFLQLSNEEEQNFALYLLDKNKTKKQKIFSGSESLYLNDFEVFKDFVVLYIKEDAKEFIEFLKPINGEWKSERISMPEDCYHISAGDNSNFDVPYFHFVYSSLTTSPSYYRYHLSTKKWELLKEYKVPGGYDKKNYLCKREKIKSRDNKEIPVSFLYHKDYPLEKAKGIYLYVYGAYGSGMDCGFSRNILSLVDRGIAYCILHVRGGNELGRAWYEDGKFLNKKNTFNDIIDCAKNIKSRFKNLENKLILSGGSAGGLSVAASLNQEPELFSVAILNVPFVDVLNTMLDTSQALTALEYEEWGNPNENEYFQEIKSYSPYNNIQNGKKYPSCLAIASLYDQRVRYWEALKWIQRLRDRVQNPSEQYLFMNTEAGHAGSSGRYEYLKELALEFDFIFKQLEIENV
ncbi:MAG: prolyl oligopeptidase family serine peptidase [Bdellovibrionota bacterium]|nr:prolyl oligopeptidase family serine peptidase [Bdellovibrionota bacterium]